MKPAVIAMLVLCCCLGAGCESMNRMTRRPGKNPSSNQEKLVEDLKRRQAVEQQATISPSNNLLAKQAEKGRQQANFPPVSSSPDASIETLLNQAGQAERANQNVVAAGLYNQVLRTDPQQPQAHHRLGVLADQDGRYHEAQNHYQIALTQEPNNTTLLSDIGYSYYSQDRLDEAEQYLQEALRIQPSNSFARNNLAQVYGRRAQQTGSQSDIQMAREQFAMANGAAGADEQLQQILPAQPAVQEPKRFPNPFKKLTNRGKPEIAQTGSNLQAPDPELNKPTQKFIQSFEELKREAIARGEYTTSSRGEKPRDLRSSADLHNVAPDRLNDELARIDADAQMRRELALRELNPYAKSRIPRPSEGRVDAGEIERTGGFAPGPGDSIDSIDRSGRVSTGPRINPSRPVRSGAQGGQAAKGRHPSDTIPADFNSPSRDGRGVTSDPQGGGPGANYGNSSDAANNQDWQQQPGSAMARSWPDTSGSPTQYDAGGGRWDGKSVMSQDRVAPGTERFGSGFESNPGYQQNTSGPDGGFPNTDPSRFGGQPASDRTPLIQAPPGWGRSGNGTTEQGRGANSGRFTRDQYQGMDDGRQTAAQLALDAGMGEMFPGNSSESGSGNSHGSEAGNNRRQGRAPFGPRNSVPDSRNIPQRNSSGGGWPAVDPHNQSLQSPATTSNGMQPGGSGMMSPTDYAPQQVGYQNGGYPQGAVDSRGDYYGNSDPAKNGNFDGSAVRNQGEGMYRGSNGDSRRPNYGTSQNHGAPPMYFGR